MGDAMTKAKGKDFSNPHKMGFMRVLMVYYAISLLLMMAGLCLVPGQEIAYNWETARTTTSLIIDVIGLWLLSNRMRAARGFSIVVYAANVALSVTLAVISPTDFSSLVLAVVPDLAIVAYFVFSRRVKAVLIAPFSLEPKRDAPLPKPNELVFWRNLIMYYCIFALVGHWMEAGFGMLHPLGHRFGDIYAKRLFPLGGMVLSVPDRRLRLCHVRSAPVSRASLAAGAHP